MQLNLSASEASVLREVLTSHLASLRVEIGRSDHREYRDMLRQRDEVLERIVAQLGPSDA
ncbi:MAG: hypothetical protein U0587_08570 [Candidatus Binatia bacterium]